MTNDNKTDIRSQKADTIVCTANCWWCDREIHRDHSGVVQATLAYIDGNHLIAFCSDAYCFTAWSNEHKDYEIVFSDDAFSLAPMNYDAASADDLAGTVAGHGGEREGYPPEGGAPQKEGYPPSIAPLKGGLPSGGGSARKRRVTDPVGVQTFTLADVRNMKWWHPLYKELKAILKEQGHWKDLPRGGSFKPGNPHRFTEATKD